MIRYEIRYDSDVPIESVSITIPGGLSDPDQYNWLEAEIGKRTIDWWYSYPWLRFKHEEDRVKFILKWL